MGTLIIEIEGKDHFWDRRGNLRGWFTAKELDGTDPLPTESVLVDREIAIEVATSSED